MPELPEVEIVRRNLSAWMGPERAVTRVTAPASGRIEGDLQRLVGRRAAAWTRRGKVLVGAFDGGVAVVCHLGMTGKWVRAPSPRRFERIVVDLDDGARLALVDARRLGRTWVVDADAALDHPRLAALGPDPLVDGLDGPTLRARIAAGRAAPLKTRLLDQGRVAGFGNICVSEGCFRAGVHPHARVDRLDADAWARLAAGLLAHIHDTLADEMGDEIHYVTQGGDNPFAVYGRQGAPCPRCGAPITKAALAGRPSFFCPRCQPEPGARQ